MDINFASVASSLLANTKQKLHCLSACVFYLTVDTLYVSFVSPGCQQESKVARITVVAGHSDLLIMGWGSDVAG